jgi:hypothetical protein
LRKRETVLKLPARRSETLVSMSHAALDTEVLSLILGIGLRAQAEFALEASDDHNSCSTDSCCMGSRRFFVWIATRDEVDRAVLRIERLR